MRPVSMLSLLFSALESLHGCLDNDAKVYSIFNFEKENLQYHITKKMLRIASLRL